ncbi:hypothetical protein LZ31DRAFT_292365 [Colletotrichum somersetense]|nr:hypothetical protein LZ31DRAFT_292365 [Colletotrichum somersetense]
MFTLVSSFITFLMGSVFLACPSFVSAACHTYPPPPAPCLEKLGSFSGWRMWNPGEDVDSAKKEKKNSPSIQQLSLARLDEGELSQALEASVIVCGLMSSCRAGATSALRAVVQYGRVGIWADGRFCTSTYPPYHHPSAITLFTSHRCRRLPIVPTYAYKACSRAGKTRALVGLAGLKHALPPREAYRVSGCWAVLYEVL